MLIDCIPQEVNICSRRKILQVKDYCCKLVPASYDRSCSEKAQTICSKHDDRFPLIKMSTKYGSLKLESRIRCIIQRPLSTPERHDEAETNCIHLITITLPSVLPHRLLYEQEKMLDLNDHISRK